MGALDVLETWRRRLPQHHCFIDVDASMTRDAHESDALLLLTRFRSVCCCCVDELRERLSDVVVRTMRPVSLRLAIDGLTDARAVATDHPGVEREVRQPFRCARHVAADEHEVERRYA